MRRFPFLLTLASVLFACAAVPIRPSHAAEEQSQPPSVNLTEQEREWLKEHPSITVVQDTAWPPVEFADDRGEPLGISSDYLKLIEKRTGIRFVRVQGTDWQDSYARLKRWEIDMTTCVARTQEREEFWKFTRPYMSIPVVIFARDDVTYIHSLGELAGKNVAVVGGYAMASWVERDFPRIRLVKVGSAREGFEAVRQGKAVAYIDNILVGRYILSKLKNPHISIAGETPYINAQCMAVRKDWPVLQGILQKGLDSVTETEREMVYQRWLPLQYGKESGYYLFWRIGAILALIVVVLVLWVHVLLLEIRKRKAAEQGLIHSQARFNRFVDSNIIGIAVGDRAGRILEANDYYLRLTGYTREEFECNKLDWRLLTPEEWRARDEQAACELEENGTCRLYEKEYVRRNGVRVRILLTKAYLPGPEKHIVAFVLDLSERTKTETALQRTEARYRLLFEHSPDGILIIDPQTTRFIEFNTAAHVHLGYTREEFAKLRISDVETIETPWETGEQIARVLREGKRDFETIQRTKTGELRNVLVTAQVVNILGMQVYQCVWRDITELKKAELSLRDSERRLQQSRELYRTFIDSSGDLAFVKDANFRYLISNRTNTAFFQKKAEEIIGKTDFDLMPLEMAQRCRQSDLQALRSEDVSVSEEQVGGQCFETRKFRVVLSNGSIGVGGYIRNITALKKNKEAGK